MNIIDVCKILYPDDISRGNITFRKPDQDILIGTWNVSGVQQPTEEYLLSLIPTYINQFNIDQLKNSATRIISNIIDTTAQSKQYENGVSCASYLNSTNPQWASEAQAFISWRDSCYLYAFNLLNDVVSGGEIPSEQEFIAGIPVIVWP